MKKIIIGVLVGAVVLLGLALVVLGLSLDGLIKRGVETIGPKVADVPVKLDSVSLSLLTGSGTIRGLMVGNPAGFKSPSAIQVQTAELSLEPGSVLKDKVIIKSIRLDGPEITFETDLKDNNLSRIRANVSSATGGDSAAAKPGAAAANQGASRKLQVNDFLITGAKLHVGVTALGGQTATVPLPEIHLTDLGTGPEGITAGELTRRVLQAVEKEAIQVSGSVVADLGKNAAGLTKNLGTNATHTLEKISTGLGGLFKKK